MMQTRFILLAAFACCCFLSCRKYLDEKPDKKMVVPATLKDVQAILDNGTFINNSYSATPEIAADNYYLPFATWSSLSNINERGMYIWEGDAVITTDWNSLYKIIFVANTALQTLAGIESPKDQSWADHLKGTALFFRGYTFYQLAELFAPTYVKQTAGAELGIPLRLSPDLNEVTVRSSLQQTYDQVIADLKEATALLPVEVTVKSRPSKAAGYAALARAYLAMEEYALAGTYADSCLQLHPTLLNYNSINPTAAFPFPRFNDEVIFHTQSYAISSILNGHVDTLLYDTYAADDLRQSLFFNRSGNRIIFKGNYYGGNTGSVFTGLASDEIYLIKAESEARIGKVAAAMQTLNRLLEQRWKQGAFQPLSAAGAEEALRLILRERRKELLFRGLRWYDLRRLNKDPRFAITLVRNLEGKRYELPPGDNRYVLSIPPAVIKLSGIPQNKR